MTAQQDSRDFVRLLAGKEPIEVLEQHNHEVQAAEAHDRRQQEQTRSQRLEFIRRLTGKTTTTEKENTK